MSRREMEEANRTAQAIKKYIIAFALFLAIGAFAALYLDKQEAKLAGLAIAVLIVVYGLRRVVGRPDTDSKHEDIERKKQQMSRPRNSDEA